MTQASGQEQSHSITNLVHDNLIRRVGQVACQTLDEIFFSGRGEWDRYGKP